MNASDEIFTWDNSEAVDNKNSKPIENKVSIKNDPNQKYFLRPHNAKKKIISNIEYPRVYEPLYRGIKNWELSEVEVLSAMLGDESKTINSSSFQSIRDKFQDIHNKFLSDSLEFLNNDQKATLNNKKSLTLLDATKETKSFIDEELSLMSNEDYEHLLSNEYGKANPFFLYATVFFDYAKHYSSKIIMIDSTVDAVDLNYWRSQNGSDWRDWPADTGEFIISSHVPANKIMGYFDVSKRKYPDNTTKMFSIPVSYAFFKMNIENEEYILFAVPNKTASMSGQTSRGTCIIPGMDTIYHCKDVGFNINTDYGDISPQIPARSAGEHKAKIVGVIKICGKKSSKCVVSNNILEKSDIDFNLSLVLNNDVKKFIQDLKKSELHGVQLRTIFNEEDLSLNRQ